MATVISEYSLQFSQPLWLLTALVAVPVVGLAWRNLAALGGVRRLLALVLRVLVIGVLAVLLAGPTMNRKRDQVTVVTVLDRSRSVPEKLRQGSLAFLKDILSRKPAGDRVAVVDVAERALIERLPGTGTEINARAPSLNGDQTDLAAGLQLAMAIAPPDSAGVALRFALAAASCHLAGPCSIV